jgi:hypothetical protein
LSNLRNAAGATPAEKEYKEKVNKRKRLGFEEK